MEGVPQQPTVGCGFAFCLFFIVTMFKVKSYVFLKKLYTKYKMAPWLRYKVKYPQPAQNEALFH